MAIAFDAATDGGNVNPGTSLTFSHTCTGSNLILFVGFNGDNIGGADDVSSVTYNSVAMTLANKQVGAGTGGDRNTYLYYLIGPATGAHNVVITCSSSHVIQGGAVSYTGVKQSSQPDNTAINAETVSSNKTLTTSLTTVNDNCWTVLVENCYDGGPGAGHPGAGAGTTRRTADGTNGGWGLFDSNAVVHPAGSTSLTTTRVSDPFGLEILHVMASFQPDTGGGATVTYPQLERGIRGLNRGICLGAY
jgi:hypothetical protein